MIYRINHGAEPSITCLKCGRTSHNPHDVEERYCGFCHRFHDRGEELPPDVQAELEKLATFRSALKKAGF